jgi:hypothetical protein
LPWKCICRILANMPALITSVELRRDRTKEKIIQIIEA